MLPGLSGGGRSHRQGRPGKLLPAPQRHGDQSPGAPTGAQRGNGIVRPQGRTATFRSAPGRAGKHVPDDRRHQLRGLRLADRTPSAQPEGRGRGQPQPVQSSPERALERCAVTAQRAVGRTAPHRLRGPPVSGRPGGRTPGEREPALVAPTGCHRPALDAGHDGNHGDLAGVQPGPVGELLRHPPLDRAAADHAHRLLLLYRFLQGCVTGSAYPPPDHGRVGIAGHRRRLCRRHMVDHHRPGRALFRCGGHVRPLSAGRAIPGAQGTRAHSGRHRATGQPAAGLLPEAGCRRSQSPHPAQRTAAR